MNNLTRFLDKIEFTDTCWLWTASISRSWYGRFKLYGLNSLAHRVSYEWFVGLIPDGLQIDHLCKIRNCVNPSHLELVTCKENILRGIGVTALNAKKTHCLHGHEYTKENTYKYGQGQRRCKKCCKRSMKKYYWNKNHSIL